ncbi:Putative Trk system potassium uptake protein TrkH [groundwater metagenome]|uniref:Putative Trk system potassium uptake protein TrkH n=1 Tax=groundwater metagenome TaxID=717931 RepID=A0A098EB01_9ZZZZ
MRYIDKHDLKIVLKFLGEALQIIGISVFILGFFSLISDYKHYENISYILPGGLMIVLASFLSRVNVDKSERMETRHALVLSAIAWLIIPLFCSIPFYIASTSLDPLTKFVDAYFEAMSAFTGAGLSMIQNLDTHSSTFLFFRSGLAWIGSVGIIMLFLLILSPSPAVAKLYSAEARTGRIKSTMKGTVREIWKIYILWTIIGVIALLLLGVNFLDSAAHIMTAIGTQGFSTHDTSIGFYYNNIPVQIVLMLFMIMGAISFYIHFNLLDRKFSVVLRNLELKIFILLIVIGSVVICANLLFLQHYATDDAVKQSTFNVVSAVTTTGFSNTDIGNFDNASKFILIILMIIGGCSISTAGGLKVLKILILTENAWMRIKKALLPESAVVKVKLGGILLTEEEISYITFLAFLFFIIYGLGVIIFLYLGYPTMDALFVCATAISNNGVNTLSGTVWFDMNILGKTTLVFLMYAGRLEILPVLALIFGIVKRIK